MMSAKQDIGSRDQEPLSQKFQRIVANLRLEGIEPSLELLADMKLLESGKLTEDQFSAKAIARAKS